MADSGNLMEFLRQVRRRLITIQLLRQSVLALTAGLAGLILLLLVGTQVMDWYWPALLFGLAFFWGGWRFFRALPDSYQLAQRVDARLGLADALSTALHFLSGSGPIVESQRGRANHLAATLRPADAIPMVWPKSVYAVAVLTLIAGSLMAVRYGVLHTLDLRAPVSEAMIDVFRPADEKRAAAKRNADPWLNQQLQQIGLTPEDAATEEERKFDGVQQGEITTPQIPDVNDLSDAASNQQAKGGQERSGQSPGEPQNGAGDQPSEKPGEGESEQGTNGSDQKAQQNAQQSQKAQQKQGGNNGQPGENSSLMDKMKDAFANMMNKLKMPNQDGQQQASNQKGASEKGSGANQQKGGQPGQQQQAKEGEGQPNGDSPGNESGEEGQKTSNAKGQGADSDSRQKAPPDAKAGVGKADGDKSLRDAEQQQAMGKISELFGKRAQNIAGEVMVEVSGGKQQLRTQYTRSAAATNGSSGDIHRDEVPLHHQQYVQQYFEQVRKQEPATKN